MRIYSHQLVYELADRLLLGVNDYSLASSYYLPRRQAELRECKTKITPPWLYRQHEVRRLEFHSTDIKNIVEIEALATDS